ncbi:MAG TPA: CHAD domain-containing protein [Candidatus Binataceae bacterium]|nr:CHAD domain-containing protein [Candidatus Binataceae bacterium]
MAAAIKDGVRRLVRPGPGAASTVANARDLFEQIAGDLRHNFNGVNSGDSEAIHQFHIAIGRMRALLELYRPALHKQWYAKQREEVRFFAHTIGGLRDTDILQETLRDAALTIEVLSDALGPLHQMLTEQRRRKHKELCSLVTSPRFEGLVSSIPTAPFSPAVSENSSPRDLIRPLVRKVKRAGAKLSRDSSPREFHRLRVRIKRLRYVLEMLNSKKTTRTARVVKKLKDAQEVLGFQHDGITAMTWLYETAESGNVSGPTCLAAGTVYEVLHQRSIDASVRAWKKWKGMRHRCHFKSCMKALRA